LLVFSAAMWSSRDYAQVRAVTEWQPPFGSGSYFMDNFPYLAWAYAALLLLVWSGLALRLKARPLLDIGQVALVTLLSIRQNRFIPYFAIVAFPVLVRSWHAHFQRSLGAASQPERASLPRALAQAALALAVLLTTLALGYPLGPGRSSTFGLGFAATNPYDEVAFLRREGLQGNLYNEQMTEGAFLIHELYPAVKPAMDMRLDVYGPELCAEYDATKSSAQRLSDYLDKYGFGLALVTRGGWVERSLEQSGRWRRAFSSQARSVLTRQLAPASP
jgi:hypothetical protein